MDGANLKVFLVDPVATAATMISGIVQNTVHIMCV